MMNIARTALKKAFGSLGYSLARIPAGNPYDFAPRPEDRYLWIRKLGIRTILDVGGHTGESALQFREMLPEAMIYSFEPLKDCYKELERNLAGKTNHQAFNIALGDKPGTSEIHRSEYSASSSLLPMADLHKSAYPFTAKDSVETIEVDTLDAVAARLRLNAEILLKIDTQGFEKSVLTGGAVMLKTVRLIIVETSFSELYKGQPLFPEIYRMLQEYGFEYRGSWDQFLNPKDGSPIQQDGIFLRSP